MRSHMHMLAHTQIDFGEQFQSSDRFYMPPTVCVKQDVVCKGKNYLFQQFAFLY